MSDSIKELKENIVAFREARNRKQFHNPEDLAISISLEAVELLEIFQWSGADNEVDIDMKLKEVREELADVLIYPFRMGNDIGFDISEIDSSKIDENEKMYPIEKALGRADKYTADILDGETGRFHDLKTWCTSSMRSTFFR